jgi:hypothetical protein
MVNTTKLIEIREMGFAEIIEVISELIKLAFLIPLIRIKYRMAVLATPLKIAPYHDGFS